MNVIGWLVQIEPEQAALLESVCSGPTFTEAEMTASGALERSRTSGTAKVATPSQSLFDYERQRDQLREQLAVAEIELSAATENQLDIEGALAFAEHLLTNAARLWSELGLGAKQQLQGVLFPEGVTFDGKTFGTAVTCLAFKQLREETQTGLELASPSGIEPESRP